MSKKRKTKSQKIIASLHRELRKNKIEPKAIIVEEKIIKKINTSSPIENLYNYDPKLIVKDILKTSYLAILFFLIIGFFFWFFKIQQIYHL